MTQLKAKECRKCRDLFTPWNTLQVACTPQCAQKLAREKREAKLKSDTDKAKKAQRASDRLWREANKGLPKLKKEAQQAFNKYVRARDKGKPCISCNRLIPTNPALTGHSIDCGHYRSVGAAGHLRYNLWNAHAQCVSCNRDLSGNVVDYRICLIRRIGQDKVDQIECDNSIRKFDADYLRRIKIIFNKRARNEERNNQKA
jgi:hypothetical protein